MPFFSRFRKSRKAVRKTGVYRKTSAYRKKKSRTSRSKFPFKKLFRKYPTIMNARMPSSKPAAYSKPFISSKPYGTQHKKFQFTNRSPNLNSFTGSIKPLSDIAYLTHEIEPTYFTNDDRLCYDTFEDLPTLIQLLMDSNVAVLQKQSSARYISFEELSVRVKYYPKVNNGAFPTHGYYWLNGLPKLEQNPFKKHKEQQYGLTFDGLGDMMISYNISGFIEKAGYSPVFDFKLGDISRANLVRNLSTAPRLVTFAYFPSDGFSKGVLQEVGRYSYSLRVRFHEPAIASN